MKLCVSNWSLQEALCAGQMDLAGFLDFCRQNGVLAVELLDEFVDVSTAELALMLKARGMRLGAWSVLNNFLVPGERALEEQIALMKRGVDIAKSLDARVVRVFSGDSDDMDKAQGMRRIADAYRECAPYAQAAGVSLALENHGVFAGTSGQILEILRAVNVPSMATTLDPCNYLFVDEDPLAASRSVAAHAAHVHVKDYRPSRPGEEGWPSLSGRLFTGVPVSEGALDWPGVLDALSAEGYDGYLSIEYEGADPIEGTARSIRALRKML